jgi:hypothetical protein
MPSLGLALARLFTLSISLCKKRVPRVAFGYLRPHASGAEGGKYGKRTTKDYRTVGIKIARPSRLLSGLRLAYLLLTTRHTLVSAPHPGGGTASATGTGTGVGGGMPVPSRDEWGAPGADSFPSRICISDHHLRVCLLRLSLSPTRGARARAVVPMNSKVRLCVRQTRRREKSQQPSSDVTPSWSDALHS